MYNPPELDAIYRRLPRINCKGKCAGSCGPIMMERVEADNIRRTVGDKLAVTPAPTTGETVVIVTNYDPKCGNCPMLQNKRCSVYDQRPLICRLWGMVKKMRCPFGCRPTRWVSDAEAKVLFEAVADLSKRENPLQPEPCATAK